MHTRIQGMAALALLAWATGSQGEELSWRPVGTRPVATRPPTSPVQPRPVISLGRPEPVQNASFASAGAPAEYVPLVPVSLRSIVRGQSPDPFPPPPPPPPPPGFGGTGSACPPGEEAYNCGVANQPHSGGGCFGDFCDKIFGGFKDIGGARSRGTLFQSDHCFDGMISPVTSPFYFEDPRALTEIRPFFIWQRTPSSNPIFAGGNNYFAGARASLAVSNSLSFTIDQLGWVWMNPDNPNANFTKSNGFAELHFGPKLTFLRNESTGTVAAAGFIVEIPTGNDQAFQNTQNMGLSPYLSFGQSFGRSDFGSFNFMSTGGYSHGFGSPRGDFMFTSLHLDYDVGNLHKIYPLVELNWAYYNRAGTNTIVNFEGRDLFHFGAQRVRGVSDLNIAFGARYKFSEAVQLGIAAEFNVLGPTSRHMDAFRMTFDMIFRY